MDLLAERDFWQERAEELHDVVFRLVEWNPYINGKCSMCGAGRLQNHARLCIYNLAKEALTKTPL